jgi:alkylated DNA repair dioxygenase AlkB
LPLEGSRYKEYTAKRRTASYGFDYDFSSNQLRMNPGAPLPEFLMPLRGRAAAWLGVDAADVKHALVTEYRPGAALGWHRDAPDFELVCGISLASSCRMTFRQFPPRPDKKSVLSLDLAPRSAYVLRGDARWRWQHSIPPAKALRYSITFRTLAK